MSKQHFRTIDIAKGIGIILVVMGHALNQTTTDPKWVNILHYLIYSFHMPLFFVLSGFLGVKILTMQSFQERVNYILKRAVRLLVPYFVIGFLYIPVKLKLDSYAVMPFEPIDTLKLLIGNNPDVSLWFLYILFIVSALSALFVNEENFRSFLYGAGALCAASWWVNLPFRTPKYLFFFLAGMWLRLKFEDLQKEGEDYLFQGQTAAVFLILLIFLVLNRIYYRTGVSILKLGTSFCGIYLTLWFSEYLLRKRSGASLTSMFEKVGSHSMDIYILHEPVMTAVRIVTWNIMGLHYAVCIGILFFTALLIPIPLSRFVIRKSRVLNLLFLGERGEKKRIG